MTGCQCGLCRFGRRREEILALLRECRDTLRPLRHGPGDPHAGLRERLDAILLDQEKP